MREYMGLFRGKRLGNGEWIEGYFIPALEKDSYSIYDIEHPELGYYVDPDTVGECTGLTDKNGKLIFEGDIVEGHCHSAWPHRLQRCAVAYSRDGFEARNYISGLDSEYYTYRVRFSRDVVVIGTVHDNPELLKGGEG